MSSCHTKLESMAQGDLLENVLLHQYVCVFGGHTMINFENTLPVQCVESPKLQKFHLSLDQERTRWEKLDRSTLTFKVGKYLALDGGEGETKENSPDSDFEFAYQAPHTFPGLEDKAVPRTFSALMSLGFSEEERL